jgi:hypothetical protein
MKDEGFENRETGQTEYGALELTCDSMIADCGPEMNMFGVAEEQTNEE